MQLILKGVQLIAIFIVRAYQLVISPFFPSSCRHVPTCSQYMIEALEIHGPFKGFYLGLKRLLRCHPWGTSGYDPVPPAPDDAGKDTKIVK